MSNATDALDPPSPPGNQGLGARAQWARTLNDCWPRSRRVLITGLGAVCALGLGVATADAVRLPPELLTADAAPDQMLLQDEPASVTTARANALNNPPDYRVQPSADLVRIDNPQAGLEVEDLADADAAPDKDGPSDDLRMPAPTSSSDAAAHAENRRSDRADDLALEAASPVS